MSANSVGSDMNGAMVTGLEQCTAPNDEVAVTGALREVLLAELAPDLDAQELWTPIVRAGFRSVGALRRLTVEHLERMGMDMGTAAHVHSLIHPVQVQRQMQAAQEPPVNVTSSRAVRLGSLRPFPAVDAAGRPDIDGWEIYGAAFQTHVHAAVTQEAEELFEQVDADPEYDLGGWVQGCPDDIIICLLYTSPSPRD